MCLRTALIPRLELTGIKAGQSCAMLTVLMTAETLISLGQILPGRPRPAPPFTGVRTLSRALLHHTRRSVAVVVG